MDSLDVRTALEADLPALMDLYGHLNAEDPPYPPDEAAAIFRQFERYPENAIFLGFAGEALVTSCTVVIVPNLTRGGMSYALIENVVTHADHRNRGFGKAVLKAAVAHAWAEGCYKAMLMTGSREPGTLAFYAGAGFEQSKTGFQVRRGAGG